MVSTTLLKRKLEAAMKMRINNTKEYDLMVIITTGYYKIWKIYKSKSLLNDLGYKRER
jgi:hypothetical protein